MMNTHKIWLHPLAALAAVVSVLLAPLNASAQTFPNNSLRITLVNITQTAGPGATVTFTGSVTNQYTQTVFLNGASATPTNPNSSLTGDPSPFLNASPDSLAVGASFPATGTASLFTINIAANTQPGSYAGTFSIFGGADGNATSLVGSTPFTVVVAPEPTASVDLGFGVLGLSTLILLPRRKQAL